MISNSRFIDSYNGPYTCFVFSSTLLTAGKLIQTDIKSMCEMLLSLVLFFPFFFSLFSIRNVITDGTLGKEEGVFSLRRIASHSACCFSSEELVAERSYVRRENGGFSTKVRGMRLHRRNCKVESKISFDELRSKLFSRIASDEHTRVPERSEPRAARKLTSRGCVVNPFRRRSRAIYWRLCRF